MAFDHETICTAGDGSAGEICDQFSFSAGVRWVDNDGQVGHLTQGDYAAEVEHIARGVVVASDAALTKDNVFISTGKNVLGCHHQFFKRGGQSAFQYNRLV